MRGPAWEALLFGCSIIMLGCSVHVPVERPVRPETASEEPIDWDYVFAHPSGIEVFPLLVAKGESPRDFLLNIDHDRVEDKSDDDVTVPVLAYLVRHPEQGDFLVDTGFDHSFTDDGSGNFGGLASLIDWVEQTPGHDTVSLLRELEVEPESLKFIVISHLHPDHTAGLPDLPKSVPVFAGPEATRSYLALWYAPADHFLGWDEIQTYDFSGLPDEGPGPSIDLFGDGSFFVVSTPGHVYGNMSFVINGVKGPLLLACDACHLQEGFRNRVRPGNAVDPEAAQRSVERLAEFARQHPSLRVKAGHDPADWDMDRGLQDPL